MASKIASSSKSILQAINHTYPVLPNPRLPIGHLPFRTFCSPSSSRSTTSFTPISRPHSRSRLPQHPTDQLRCRSASSLPSTSTPNNPPPPTPFSSSKPPTLKVTPPSIEKIKFEGFFDEDISLIPESEANIILTPEAANQLAIITSREPPDTLEKSKLALRVGVESGGCHGYQYTMALTEERGVDDYVFQPEGVKSIPVVVDLVSLGLLKGSTLHYGTELIGSSFRLLNNPQAKEGGACGCGVSWEAKM